MSTHDPISDLRRYAADLAGEVSPSHAEMAASRAIAHARAPRRTRTSLVAAGTAALLAVSNVALAGAANPSVPGDVLYRLDRAYESVGQAIGLGGDVTSERLSEAEVLASRGDPATAIELVREALDGVEDGVALDRARALISSIEDSSASPTGAELADLLEMARSAADEAARTGDVAGDPGPGASGS